jgi:hypothetical protein
MRDLVPTRILLLALVFGAHVAGQFLLYGERVYLFLNRIPSPWFESGFFVFYLPLILTIALYVLVLRIPWPQPPRLHPVASVALSLGLVFLSWWAGMFLSLNTYGE